MRKIVFDFSRLSIAERMQLAEDLWDSSLLSFAARGSR